MVKGLKEKTTEEREIRPKTLVCVGPGSRRSSAWPGHLKVVGEAAAAVTDPGYSPPQQVTEN